MTVNINSMNANWFRSGALVLGLVFAGAATAQAQDTQSMPNPQVQPETCSQVNWSPRLLSQYPRIADGCQEIVTINGTNWARFEGTLVSVNSNGSVTSTVKNRDGRQLGVLRLKPAAGQMALIDGRNVPFSALSPGQNLNLYVAEGAYAVATEPGVATSDEAQILPPPDEVAATTAELPHTAGPLPWVALAGAVLLVGASGLALRRWLWR